MGWNGTIKAEFVKITYDEKKNYTHTYAHENTFIHMYTHIYTYTYSEKKIEDEFYVVGLHGVEWNH